MQLRRHTTRRSVEVAGLKEGRFLKLELLSNHVREGRLCVPSAHRRSFYENVFMIERRVERTYRRANKSKTRSKHRSREYVGGGETTRSLRHVGVRGDVVKRPCAPLGRHDLRELISRGELAKVAEIKRVDSLRRTCRRTSQE